MTFAVETEQVRAATYVVSVAGELDMYTAPDVEQQLLDVFGQGGTQIVVDLSATTFIDSVALGVLVSAMKHLRSVEGRMALVCGHRDVVHFFEIAGLDRWFSIYPTRVEALAQLEG